jgi:hypothetical protein
MFGITGWLRRFFKKPEVKIIPFPGTETEEEAVEILEFDPAWSGKKIWHGEHKIVSFKWYFYGHGEMPDLFFIWDHLP